MMQIHMSTPRLELWKIEHSFSNDSHVHDNYYQVTVPVYGSCRFEVENRSLLLESGEALIHCPNDRHSFQLEDGEGVVIFQLERDIGERWELKRPWEPAVKQQINVEELLRQHRKWLMTLCTADPSEAGSIEETETDVMDYLFHTLLGNHHDRVGVRSLMPSSDTNDPHLKRVIEYMHDCYMQPISIDLLASLAGMSRFHFIRSFKLLTRFAPYQYMLAIRIDEAKQRLRSTRMTVTEISLDVGFSSPSQLYRAFHKFTGMSPEQYRQHS